MLRPYLSAYKIDLKCMQDKNYRQLGGCAAKRFGQYQTGPGMPVYGWKWLHWSCRHFNDDPKELWDAARFLASISEDIPWHVTAYHPDYRMTDRGNTTARSLQTAAEIGQEAGLHYVYAGNLPGRVGSLENTYCPNCNTLLIERYGYVVHDYAITAGRRLPATVIKKLPGFGLPHQKASVWMDGECQEGCKRLAEGSAEFDLIL